MANLIIKNANEIITLADGNPKKGKNIDIGRIKNTDILIKDGIIAKIKNKIVNSKNSIEIDAKNKIVMPGFIDCHTHLVFAGDRSDEFAMRVNGKTYKEIQEAGGGIINTVKKTRAASVDELYNLAMKRLNYALAWGTTTIEIKSGYGLSYDEEIKMLKVIDKLAKTHAISIIPTFLGAHSVPKDKSKKEYIDEIIKMLPEVSKYAKFCDVFCEQGIFTKNETKKILLEAKKYNLIPKIHADELTQSGGSELAGEIGAIEASHLVYPSDKGIDLMKKNNVIAVLLPGSCLYLNHMPPVKKFIDCEIPIAIGSDFNPGSSPILAMPIIISLACNLLKMSIEQAIAGATINAAYALSIQDKVGSIEEGKIADLIILNAKSYKELPYWMGFNLVDKVIKNGKIIYETCYSI